VPKKSNDALHKRAHWHTTKITDAALRELRLRYNAAYSAYQSCVMALNEAIMSGQSAELLEAKSLRELTESRAKLLRGIAGLVFDHDA